MLFERDSITTAVAGGFNFLLELLCEDDTMELLSRAECLCLLLEAAEMDTEVDKAMALVDKGDGGRAMAGLL